MPCNIKFLLMLCSQLTSFSWGSEQTSLRGRRQEEEVHSQQDPCLLLFRNEVGTDYGETASLACQLQGRDAEVFGPVILDMDNVSVPWATIHNVISGQSTLFVPGTRVHNDRLVLPPSFNTERLYSGNLFYRGALSSNDIGVFRNHNNRKLASSTGNKSVLVVRVAARDFSTSSNAADLSDKVFGTSGDKINVVERFKACSYNKLVLRPTQHPRAVGGVYTVTIPQSVQFQNEKNVERFVTNKLKQDLGDLGSQFDHILYCLPAKTNRGNFLAYGYINYWLTVYNDKWCEYPSSQAHEIGHNLFLSHSGLGSNSYADQSGLMGYSYSQDEGPLMCFNAAKSWQLGWYSDRHSVARPLTSTWNWKLAGIADYSNSYGKTVILKIEGDRETDYYVNFNRKDGINSGTVSGGDLVLVTARPKGTGYAASRLVARLDTGDVFVDKNFGVVTRETMSVKVNNIDWNARPVTAEVTVTSTAIQNKVPQAPVPKTPPPTRNPSPRPTPNPTPRPTPNPTPRVTPNPTPRPSPNPTTRATLNPTPRPTPSPTSRSTPNPTPRPTPRPTPNPTARPTPNPTPRPSPNPTPWPTTPPMKDPTPAPTRNPTPPPTPNPTPRPTTITSVNDVPSLCGLYFKDKDCKRQKGKCKWDKKQKQCKQGDTVTNNHQNVPFTNCSQIFGEKACKTEKKQCKWDKKNDLCMKKKK